MRAKGVGLRMIRSGIGNSSSVVLAVVSSSARPGRLQGRIGQSESYQYSFYFLDSIHTMAESRSRLGLRIGKT